MLAGSIVIALITSRFSVPALVAFLALGGVIGSEYVGGANFVDAEMARIVGTIGLAVILFEGGLSTSLRRLREAALSAVMLSTVGVIVTALLTGVVAHYLFGLPWLSAMLMGAVVSSTDAAAVFATLRFTDIRRRLARILEAETGGNDPMAIALTLGLITWIQQPTYHIGNLVELIVRELSIGLLIGLILGRTAMYIFARLPHRIGAFAPVASVAAACLSFGIADVIGGSGFLAVYLVGLAVGSTPSRYRGPLTMFHEGLAFLAQVVMFVIMGILIVPEDLMAVAIPSIILAIVLVVLIRPIAVWLSLPSPLFRFTRKERVLLGWAGLRGAVPIVLATYALSAHVPYGEIIFNTVFFVTLVSSLLQGTTLDWVARRLGVVDNLPSDRSSDHENEMEKIFFHVAHQHAIAGAQVHELGLPPQARLVEIRRRSKNVEVDKKTVIKARDQLLIEAPYSVHPEIEDVFMRWRRRV